MEYVKIAETSDLSAENKILVHWKDKEILITKVENSYYAIDNKCTHMGGSLYDGALAGNEIICPKHHTRFDVRSGKVVDQGKLLFISVNAKDTVIYPVKLEGTDILIGLE